MRFDLITAIVRWLIKSIHGKEYVTRTLPSRCAHFPPFPKTGPPVAKSPTRRVVEVGKCLADNTAQW
jgi:hypothetical protein